MCKRIISLPVIICLFISLLSVCVSAATTAPASTEVIHYDDGSYLVIEITVSNARAAGTKTGIKTYTRYADNGDIEWKGVLTGTFTYDGTSSECTVSICNAHITNTNWYVISKTSSKSGNSAFGGLTMGRKFLGVKIDEESIDLRLTCSANGALS